MVNMFWSFVFNIITLLFISRFLKFVRVFLFSTLHCLFEHHFSSDGDNIPNAIEKAYYFSLHMGETRLFHVSTVNNSWNMELTGCASRSTHPVSDNQVSFRSFFVTQGDAKEHFLSNEGCYVAYSELSSICLVICFWHKHFVFLDPSLPWCLHNQSWAYQCLVQYM